MFRFNSYEIYVIYSRNRQKRVEPFQRAAAQDLELHRRRLKNMSLGEFGRSSSLQTIAGIGREEGLLAAAYQWDLIEDLTPTHKLEIQNYEHQVKRSLTEISHTRIGRLLLNSINRQEKVYIIPLYDYDTQHSAITTSNYSEAEGGGIRIAYNPGEFSKAWRGGVVSDLRGSVLCHELVHASHKSYKREYRDLLSGGSFPNIAEFFASQIQNIYTSETGESKFYNLYYSLYAPKEVVYRVLTKDRQLILALRNLLRTEPLAQEAAKLTKPDYNPFRDYKELEEASHQYFGTGGFIDL